MRCLFTAVRVKTFDIIDPLCVFYFGKFQSKDVFFKIEKILYTVTSKKTKNSK